MKKHPPERHGMWYHPAYQSWANMHRRCRQKKAWYFRYYGRRGIFVVPIWKSFVQFWKDMGPTWKPGLTLDRKDTNGNYEPDNCRWATRRVQIITTRKRKGTSSIFRGVTWDKSRFCWSAGITTRGQHISLGRFEQEEDAARAWDVAAKKYHGEEAQLNFKA